MPRPTAPCSTPPPAPVMRPVSPLFLLLLLLQGAAATPVFAQVRHCAMPDGNHLYTDRSCQSLGAVEVAYAATTRPPATRVYHGRCAATLPDLVYELTSAIDSRDVNRLAAHYHWPGMAGGTANATMDRLDVMASRPLLDLRLMTADVPGGPATNDPWAAPEVRVVPTGVRVEQLTREGGQPVTTSLSLRRHHGCWWVRL